MGEYQIENSDIIRIVDVGVAETDDAIVLLRELRKNLDDDTFHNRLKIAMGCGYHMIAALHNQTLVGMLGYRITNDICWGKTLYIDDLNVAPEQRSSGIGKALIESIKTRADELECDCVRLCSGRSRTDAHRFYHANGFEFFSHQFVQLKVDR